MSNCRGNSASWRFRPRKAISEIKPVVKTPGLKMLIWELFLITSFFTSASTASDVEQSNRACLLPILDDYNVSEVCASSDDIPPSLCSSVMVDKIELLQKLRYQYDDYHLKYLRTLIPAYFRKVTLTERKYVETLQFLVTNVPQKCAFLWTSLLEEELTRLQIVEQEDEVVMSSELWVFYILPPFVCFTILVALPFNLVLMVIILRHPEMRTCPNIILLNLSVGDTLFLLIHVVFNYFQVYWEIELSVTACCVYAYINALTTNLSVYSMVVLSFQRFMATRNTLRGSFSANSHHVLVLSVWVLSGLAALFAVTYRRPRQRCLRDISSILAVCDFLFTCILPMLVIFVFYTAASRRLIVSVQSMPGEASGLRKTRRHRERGASILPALSVVFAITYLPVYTMDTVQILVGFSYTRSEALMHLYHITLLLFPLNSCLNPVALCFASKNFRLHFENYFLCRCTKKKIHSRSQSGSKSVTRSAENVF